MGELDATIRPDAHEPGFFCGSQRVGVDELQVRPGQGRSPEQRVPSAYRERANARRDQRAEALRDRELDRAAGVGLSLEQPRNLERVQRVALRCGRDPHQHGTREGMSQLLGEDAVQGGKRKRAELQALDEPLAREILEYCGLGLLGPHREDRLHGRIAHTPERELERSRGRCVEPMKIVDRDQHLSVGPECAQKREQCRSDQARFGRPLRRRHQQRHL